MISANRRVLLFLRRLTFWSRCLGKMMFKLLKNHHNHFSAVTSSQIWIKSQHALGQRLANFLLKDKTVNSFSFVGHMVSVTTTQLRYCAKDLDNTKINGHDYAPLKLYKIRKWVGFDPWANT